MGGPSTITHMITGTLTASAISAGRSRSASRSTSASSSSRRSTASSPIRWRCLPTPATICRTCSGWSSPGRGPSWPSAAPLRASLMGSRRRRSSPRWPIPCSCSSRSERSAPRRSAGSSIHRRPTGGVVIVVAAIGIVVNGSTALLFAAGAARHQHPRRLPAHGGGRCGLGGRRLCRARNPVDGPAVGRPGDEPRRRVVILWGSIGLLKESVWMSLAGRAGGHRRRPGREPRSPELERRRSGPRSPHLAAQHDRNGADRASSSPARRLSRRRCSSARASAAPRAVPDRALHDPGRTPSSRRPQGLLIQ